MVMFLMKLLLYGVLVFCAGWGAIDELLGVPFKRKTTMPTWVRGVNAAALLGFLLWILRSIILQMFHK